MKAQHWLSKCITDDKGRALPVLANAFTALEFDPLLRDAIAYDEMQCAPMLLHQIGQLVGGDVDHPRPLTDKDISDVQKYLQHAGLERIGREPLHNAVDIWSQNNSSTPHGPAGTPVPG